VKYYETDRVKLYCGDCLEAMKGFEDNSVDAILTDPPYGLGKTPDVAEIMKHWLAGDDVKVTGGGFMGKLWDSFVPNSSVWREAFRVLKPGGSLFAFGGTRTVDLLSISIRFAGFEKFDEIEWLYGSGFPKSLNIGKAIDKAQGNEREYLGTYKTPDGRDYTLEKSCQDGYNKTGLSMGKEKGVERRLLTTGSSPWEGYGTALKPAHEVILCFRKPCEGTYAENCLKWGCGGLNIDGCRVGTEGGTMKSNPAKHNSVSTYGDGLNGGGCQYIDKGRFPANVIHDGSDEVLGGFPETSSGGSGQGHPSSSSLFVGTGGSAKDISDSGSAARFFYCAKASKSERNKGCEGMEERKAGGMEGRHDGSMGSITYARNFHPTVKPLALCEYLSKLLLPPARETPRRILIPYSGSGSEMIGALKAGWDEVIGIELSEEYCAIANARIDAAERQLKLF